MTDDDDTTLFQRDTNDGGSGKPRQHTDRSLLPGLKTSDSRKKLHYFVVGMRQEEKVAVFGFA